MSNPSGKCSYERPTRGTVCGTMRSMCGADAGCLAINYQSLLSLTQSSLSRATCALSCSGSLQPRQPETSMCNVLLSCRVHGFEGTSRSFARCSRLTWWGRREKRRRMCPSSSKSSRFLRGGVSSTTAAPQSALDNLMSSPSVLTTGSPAWPGHLLGSADGGAKHVEVPGWCIMN